MTENWKEQIVVTTGATVSFPLLIEKIIDFKFIEMISQKYINIDRILVQYGKPETSVHVMHQILDDLQKVKKVKVKEYDDEKYGIVFEFKINEILIKCVQYDNLLNEQYSKKCSIVISHAGTGTIMDVLRSKSDNKIRLIIVVNEQLADNHQKEIGDAFESLGVLECCTVNEVFDKVVSNVAGENSESKSLPASRGAVVYNIVSEMIMS